MFVFPDMNNSFNMYTTLVEEFVNEGHDVVVLAPGKGKTGIYIEKEIPVLRVRTLPIKNVPNYLKGISNLLLPYQYQLALYKFYKGKTFDLVITPTPPITLVDLAAKLKKKMNAKFYLILRDIFPQNAVDLGFMKKSGLLHKYFRLKEKKLYREADCIGCMSHGNIKYLHKHNPEVPIEKLHELKNFQKLYEGSDSSVDALRNKFGLHDKFVVVFGGNMGKPQQLENVLKLAESAILYKDIAFLLLGEGVQMDRIAATIKEKGINNIIINRTIPKQDYQNLLGTCDVGLISLHENFTIPNIPSKALDYLNVGIPVLASLDRATDFGDILDENQMGLWAYADQPEDLKIKLFEFYNKKDLREAMGKNGRSYFVKNLLPEMAYKTIISNLNQNLCT